MPNSDESLLSVIIPARNEQYLQRTVEGLLANSAGPVDVTVVLDGYLPELRPDKRVTVIHHPKALGMRPSINEAISTSKGVFICKMDAHVMVDKGWDMVMKADCDEETITIPRRYELEPETWTIASVPAVDAHRLTYPFSDEHKGKLHATKWPERSEAHENTLIDEDISSQGSCYLMRRSHWDRLRPLDHANYKNIVNEAEELCFRAWLGGGRVLVNKKTFYAHWTKVRHRGYSIGRRAMVEGYDFCVRYWMRDEWPQRIHDFQWLIERFSPMPDWPEDLDEVFRYARATLKPTPSKVYVGE